eukprot:jgi/Chlat1/6594/Chrsp46S06092
MVGSAVGERWQAAEPLPAYAGAAAGGGGGGGGAGGSSSASPSGSGGGVVGRVFKCWDVVAREHAALRQIDLPALPSGGGEAAAIAVQLEVEALRALNHRNVARYLGFARTRSHIYVAAELCDNGSLAAITATGGRFGPLPESLTAAYVSQALEGLAYLHAQGVAHGALRATNLLTTKDGLVKLADWGLAGVLHAANDTTAAPASAREDVRALGLAVLELLTGKSTRGAPPALAPSAPPKSVSPSLRDFLEKCLRKDARARPAASELLAHPWVQGHLRALARGHAAAVLSADVANVVDRAMEEVPTSATLPPRSASPSPYHTGGSPLPSPGALSPSPVALGEFRIVEVKRGARAQPPTHSRTLNRSSGTRPLRPPSPLDDGVGPLSPYIYHERGGSEGRMGRLSARSQPPSPSPLMPRTRSGQVSMHLTRHDYGETTVDDRSDAGSSVAGAHSRSDDTFAEAAATNRTLETLIADLACAPDGASKGVERSSPGTELSAADERELAKSSTTTTTQSLPGTEVVGEFTDGEQEWARARDEGDGEDTLAESLQDVGRLMGKLSVRNGKLTKEAAVQAACSALSAMVQRDPRLRARLLESQVPVVLAELLDPASSQAMATAALQLINAALGEEGAPLPERACMSGLVPAVLARTSDTSSGSACRLQAARFLARCTCASAGALQVVIACGGLRALAVLLNVDYREHREAVALAVGVLERVLRLTGPTPVNDHLRLLARAGALSSLIGILEAANDERLHPPVAPASSYYTASPGSSRNGVSSPGGAGQYGSHYRARSSGSATSAAAASAAAAADVARRCAMLLTAFAGGDSAVKRAVCEPALLGRLFSLLPALELPVLVRVVGCIAQLTTDPAAVEAVQEAGAMHRLVPLLEMHAGVATATVRGAALRAVYNLCKISRERQEAAAAAGLVRHLRPIVAGVGVGGSQAAMRRLALPLLCDMAHASPATRSELWVHGGLDLFLDLLQEEHWQVVAMDAMAVWLAADQRRVEPRLAQPDAVARLVAVFGSAEGTAFVHILDPFLKIVTKSTRINVALSTTGGLAPLLVEKLRQSARDGDNIARVSLLKICKVVYEQHPRPKQLMVEQNLAANLRSLVQREGEMVMVKQMALALLKALHVNTVL